MEMNKAEIETIKYVIKEYCPPNDLLVKAALKSLDDYAATVAQQPQEIEVQCPVCSHKFYEWPEQPQAEAVPPDVVRDALELAEEALGWHASGFCEDSMPELTVKALQAIRAAIAQQKEAKS